MRHRLTSAILLLYPRRVRQGHGPEIAALIDDLIVHEGRSRTRLFIRLAVDGLVQRIASTATVWTVVAVMLATSLGGLAVSDLAAANAPRGAPPAVHPVAPTTHPHQSRHYLPRAVTATSSTCPASHLALRVSNKSIVSAVYRYTLTLTNKSHQTCSLTGYPGVSLVKGRHGRQAGRAARRNNGPVVRIVLRHGHSASDELAEASAGCGAHPPRGTYVRVYPPGSRTALFTKLNSVSCLPYINPLVSGTVGLPH